MKYLQLEKSRVAAPLIALVGIWVLFVYGVLGPEHSFALFQDNEFLLAPILSHMSSVVRSGEWPLWMDTVLGGVPLFNLTQLSAYYPFYFLPLPLFGDPFEASRSMHLLTLGHLFIFLVNSYVLMRAIGVSRFAALAGATLIVFNANTLGYSVWINIISPYTWFPLYIAGVIQLFAAPTSIRAQAMTLVPIVLLTLASPAQPLIHAVFVTVVLAIAHGFSKLVGGERWLLVKGYATLLGVAVIAMLLSAPVLYPAVADFGDMIRWVGAFPPVMGNDRIPFEAFLTDQISARELVGVVFQVGKQLAVGSQYVGLLPIALAAFALAAPQRHWVVLPLAFLAVYALLSSTGSHLGFAQLNYEIPLINKIREPSRFLFLAHFAIGLLAAMAIDGLAKFAFSRASNEPIWGPIASLCVLLVGIVVSSMAWTNTTNYFVITLPIAATIGVLGASILLRMRRRFTQTSFVACCALTVIVTQWVTVPWRAPEVAGMDYLASRLVGLDEAIKAVGKLDPMRQYRVIFEGDIDSQKASMLASYHGVRSFNAAINPVPRRQFEELYYHQSRGDNYFRAAGGKFILCRKCPTETFDDYRFVESVGDFSIYEANALPRTYIASEWAGEFRSLGDYTSKMARLDLGQVPVLTARVSAAQWAEPVAAPLKCSRSQSKFTYNSVSAVLQCESGVLFVLNEFNNGNWQARVNGQKVKTQLVNGNQIAVALKAGANRVEFTYYPHSWVLGLRGLAAGILVIAMYLILRLILRKRTRQAA